MKNGIKKEKLRIEIEIQNRVRIRKELRDRKRNKEINQLQYKFYRYDFNVTCNTRCDFNNSQIILKIQKKFKNIYSKMTINYV